VPLALKNPLQVQEQPAPRAAKPHVVHAGKITISDELGEKTSEILTSTLLFTQVV